MSAADLRAGESENNRGKLKRLADFDETRRYVDRSKGCGCQRAFCHDALGRDKMNGRHETPGMLAVNGVEYAALLISTVSFHLKKLADAGAVTSYKSQYYMTYSLKKDVFETSILEEIVRAFAFDRIYSERETNIIIADFYDDFCTIRRDTIGEKLLNRDARGYCGSNHKGSHRQPANMILQKARRFAAHTTKGLAPLSSGAGPYTMKCSSTMTVAQHRRDTGSSPSPHHAHTTPAAMAAAPARGDCVACMMAGKVITASVTYGT